MAKNQEIFRTKEAVYKTNSFIGSELLNQNEWLLLQYDAPVDGGVILSMFLEGDVQLNNSGGVLDIIISESGVEKVLKRYSLSEDIPLSFTKSTNLLEEISNTKDTELNTYLKLESEQSIILKVRVLTGSDSTLTPFNKILVAFLQAENY